MSLVIATHGLPRFRSLLSPDQSTSLLAWANLRFLIIPWTFRLYVVSEPLLRKDNTVRRLIALVSLLNLVLVVRSISRRSTPPAMCGFKVSARLFSELNVVD